MKNTGNGRSLLGVRKGGSRGWGATNAGIRQPWCNLSRVEWGRSLGDLHD